jgi:protein gp37
VAERSSISWTHSTFNPWIGCTKVSPGCDRCYAEALDNRHRWGGEAHWGAGVPRRRTSLSNWKLPEKWERKAKATGQRHLVFCASLADVFDNEAPEGAREDLWQLIRATPHLTWQLVTKRIGNAARMLPADWYPGYPNVWLLSTIVNQEEADRDLPKLLAVPARIHGVSYEPALDWVNWQPWLPEVGDSAYCSTCKRRKKPVGRSAPMGMSLCDDECTGYREAPSPSDLWPRESRREFGYPHDLANAPRIDWIIVGGESGNGSRQFPVSWARHTIGQCRAAGVPVFVKQLGTNPLIALEDGFDPEALKAAHGTKWDKPEQWPEWLRVQEFPK